MIRSALLFPGVAHRHLDILKSFVYRDLQARYQGSILGRLWPLLHPLLLLGIYHLVFAEILGIRFAEESHLGGEGWKTTFFLLSGILPWVAFVETVARATNVVVENSNLIKKVAFPSELLPTYLVLVHLVQFLIGLVLLAVVYLIVAGTSPHVFEADGITKPMLRLLYLPIPMILQIVFTAGLAMLLATLNVFVRDLVQLMPLLLQVWMFLSPIFYSEQILENAKTLAGDWILPMLRFNPLYHLLAMYRALFFDPVSTPFPWRSMLVFAAIAAVTFVLGHGFFVRAKGRFADEV